MATAPARDDSDPACHLHPLGCNNAREIEAAEKRTERNGPTLTPDEACNGCGRTKDQAGALTRFLDTGRVLCPDCHKASLPTT